MPATEAIAARLASVAILTAAASLGLLQPAFGQAESEAIPEELRIIQDFPAPAEDLGVVGQLQEPEDEGALRTDEESLILDEDRGSLFDDDRSLLFDTRDASPAQELLADDLEPDIDLDPPAAGADSAGQPSPGPQAGGASPQDRIGAGTGGAVGGGSGGSLF